MTNLKNYFRPSLNFKEKADNWIRSNWGRRFRIGLLAGTIVVYPVYHLFTNGPFLNFTFNKKYNVDYQLPPHLQQLVQGELQKFRDQEARNPKDSKVTFCIQRDLKHLDSVGDGSLGVRFGAHIALPLYSLFTNEEQALDYCRKNMNEFEVFGKKLNILWDSPTGRELLSTMMLSPEVGLIILELPLQKT